MKLEVLNELLAIAKIEANAAIPTWVFESQFFAITKTADELSIVCEERAIPALTHLNRSWRALKVVGPLDFALTGILSTLAAPLAKAKISIFAISTFDTDYILVKSETLDSAIQVLRNEGYEIG